MKISNLKTGLVMIIALSYTSPLLAHTSGVHSGGLVQQLVHMVQSADHLFILLALGVVATLAGLHFVNKRH